MHFDLVDLRLMVKVAEHRSLTKGAQASNISVPAASIRIKNLEENVGSKLLHRKSSGAILTTTGRVFVHHSLAVLNQIEHLRGDMQQHANGFRGHLRVSVTIAAMGQHLPPAIRRLQAKYPDITIDIEEKQSQEIAQLVFESESDIGIAAEKYESNHLEVLPFRKDDLVLVVPHGHPLTKLNEIQIADAFHYNLIGMRANDSASSIQSAAPPSIIHRFPTYVQVGSYETASLMTEAGVGISIMPNSVARRHMQTMSISAIAIKDEWAQRSLFIYVRSLEELPQFAHYLVDLLVADSKIGEEIN
jgi:DNA-binding transcriptional LysR family regulator